MDGMLSRIGGVALVLVLSLVLAVGLAGPAAAKKKKKKKTKFYGANVTLIHTVNASGTDTFSGTLTSPFPGCKVGAQVELRALPPDAIGGSIQVATATTAADGTYSLAYEPTGGTAYQAVDPGRIFKQGGVRRDCLGDMSDLVRVVKPAT